MRKCGRASTRNPIRLLDQHNREAFRVCDARHRDEIFRLNPTAGAVAEDERSARVVRLTDMRLRNAERRADLERRHRFGVRGSFTASRPPRRNVITGSITAATWAGVCGFAFDPPRSVRTMKAAVSEAATTWGRRSSSAAPMSFA